MTNSFTLSSERVDDLPILWVVIDLMRLPEILNEHLRIHGNSKTGTTLTTGQIIAVWLIYILSHGDHRKCVMADFVDKHKDILSVLLGKKVTGESFSDDRLSTILSRLSDKTPWEAVETALYERELRAYTLDKPVFLDTSTTCGYHSISPDGLMQLGHSKDHRPDLAQVKIMNAVAAESLLASTVVEGRAADPPLYIPMIRRLQAMLGTGHLYVGDCKMSSIATRAWCASHGDFYLTSLEKKSEAKGCFDQWIRTATDDRTDLIALDLVIRDGKVLSGGYEFSRLCTSTVDNRQVEWTERVLVVRSTWLADQLWTKLQASLLQAEEALRALSPPIKRGQRQIRDSEAMEEAIDNILTKYQVTGLIKVTWEQETYEHKNGVTASRYIVKELIRDETAIADQRINLGWRMLVTNASAEQLPLSDAAILQRQSWEIERQFHILKDKPLGIRPLFVRTDDQIVGLTHLLLLAVRVLMCFEHRIRDGLAESQETIEGMYLHDTKKATASPTARRVLEAITRQNINLITVTVAGRSEYWLDSVPSWLDKLIRCAYLPGDTYSRLLRDFEQPLVQDDSQVI